MSSRSDRPRLPLPPRPLLRVLEVLTLGCFVAAVWLVLARYGDLPDRVPHHYGLDGEPTRYGGKGIVVVGPLLILLGGGLLQLLKRIPHLHNYPVKVTAENAGRLYRLSVELLGVMQLVLGAIGLLVADATSRAAGAVDWRFWLIIGAAVLLPIIYLVRIANAGKPRAV